MTGTESTWERFEALYRSSRDDVYAYAFTLLRDRGAAEDVTALSFERAYRRRRTFDRRRGEERAWLFGIARNAALDELRRRRRVAALTADPIDGGTDPRFDLGEDEAEVTLRRTVVRDANVASRTDSTTDVNDRYVSLTRQLADARALRTGLLRQLAQAATQSEIDSLHARIRDAEASVASLESSLRSLGHAVSMSQITLTINAAVAPAGHSGGSSFTLGKAAHDAGRVLTVAAGVTLIALAVLVPITLAGALVAWVAAGVRRRRRERALDLA